MYVHNFKWHIEALQVHYIMKEHEEEESMCSMYAKLEQKEHHIWHVTHVNHMCEEQRKRVSWRTCTAEHVRQQKYVRTGHINTAQITAQILGQWQHEGAVIVIFLSILLFPKVKSVDYLKNKRFIFKTPNTC